MKNVRALIVDDSRVMRNMVKKSLEMTGLADFQFTEAEDGTDALSKFNPTKIDIAFVDWNMPKMPGIDFVRKIRASKANAHVKLVMVTSERAVGKLTEALDKAGADAYICKPFTVEELQQQLGKMIENLAGASKPSGGGFFGKIMGKG